jgi:hypothetical protein
MATGRIVDQWHSTRTEGGRMRPCNVSVKKVWFKKKRKILKNIGKIGKNEKTGKMIITLGN